MNHKFSLAKNLLVLVAVCSSVVAAAQDVPPAAETAGPEPAKSSAVTADYVLQPQDLIRIQVFREDDLNREVRLSQEASVNLPLIGIIDLKGKTARQAEDFIRAAYDRDYLVNPQVNLFVVEYAKRYVNVFGAVVKQGPVVFPPEEGLTLIKAIAQAGGFSRIADKKHVTLIRTHPDGTTEKRTINADVVKGSGDETEPLQPNDTISVPEIFL